MCKRQLPDEQTSFTFLPTVLHFFLSVNMCVYFSSANILSPLPHFTAKAAKANVSVEEMEEVVNVEHMMNQFSSIVEALKQDYIKNLSLRSAAGM